MTHFTMYFGGILFGFGLAVAGATRPEVVLSFLQLKDLGLGFVIGTALVVSLIVFQGIARLMKKPLYGEKFDGHDGFPVTSRTFVGAFLFGIGWGLSGICPATSLAALGTGNWPLVFAVIGMFTGTYIYGNYRSRKGDVHH